MKPRTTRVNGAELHRRMQLLGVSGVELARRAKVAEGTVSHALSGRRIQPSTFRAIARALAALEAVPGADSLLAFDDADALGDVAS